MLLFYGFSYLAPENWKIANSCTIKFNGSGASGVFGGLKGNIIFEDNDLGESKFDVTVDADSINTGNSLKNKHAKGSDWLDVAKYPTIRFKSSKISKTTSGYETVGTLYLHGVEKQIAIPFSFSGHVFTGNFQIKRGDYNLGSSHGLDAIVAPVLNIELVVPVIE